MESQDVTALLKAWSRGESAAGDALLPLVYAELRRRAGAYLRRERQGHTLQPTALVHEAYLRLLKQHALDWQNRAHFFAIASQMMRRVLVDAVRAHRAAKRPHHSMRVELDEGLRGTAPPDCDLVLLNQALDELASLNARHARIVEMCYFGGLSETEVASVLSVSRSTVTRDWRAARAWLYRRMTTGRQRAPR